MTRPIFDLTGKTAVVVGGTSGIGRVRALAVEWARQGAASFVTGQLLVVDRGFLACGVNQ